MGRTLRGELRKLIHPVTAILVIVCFAFILIDARTTYHFSRLQTPTAVIATQQIQQAAAACQGSSGATLSEDCQNKLDDVALNNSFASNGIKLGRVTNSLSTWPGMLRFVSHQLATGLGWVLLALLIAVHVAGEWSSRTAPATLLATGSYWKFWLTKVTSTWIAMLGITFVGTMLLWLARSAYLGKVGVPDPISQPGDVSTWHLAALRPDTAWSSWSGSIGVLGVVSIVWLLLIIAGVAVAALVRRTLTSAAVGVAALSAVVCLARYADRTAWSPLGVIGQVLHLSRTPFGVRDTRLWEVPGAPAIIQDTARTIAVSGSQVAAWIAIPATVAVLATLLYRQRTVVG